MAAGTIAGAPSLRWRATSAVRSHPRLILSVASTLLTALTFKPVVENDGVGYYSYLHALWVEHRFSFASAYQAAAEAHVTFFPALLQARTATGHLADFFPIGPALFASPAYLVGLAVVGGGQQYATALVWAFVFSSLLAGLTCLALLWRLTRSVSALLAVTFATPFFYYLVYEPSYSHTFSALASTLFVVVWLLTRRHSARWWWWVAMGALGGLMALSRWQDGLLLGIALLELPRGRWRALLLIPSSMLVFAPQFWADQALFGTWFPQRPAGQGLQVWPGHYLQVLFSSYHGLFVWSPVTLLAALGFFFVPDWRLKAAFLYALLVETAINGAVPDWWGGYAFGARRFLDLVPFWAIGLAALAERVPAIWRRAVVALLVAWNVALMANFTYVIRTDHDPGYLGLLKGQLAAVRYLPHLLVQGAAGRDLIWWPWLHATVDVAPAVAALALEALAVLGAVLCAGDLAPRARSWTRQVAAKSRPGGLT